MALAPTCTRLQGGGSGSKLSSSDSLPLCTKCGGICGPRTCATAVSTRGRAMRGILNGQRCATRRRVGCCGGSLDRGARVLCVLRRRAPDGPVARLHPGRPAHIRRAGGLRRPGATEYDLPGPLAANHHDQLRCAPATPTACCGLPAGARSASMCERSERSASQAEANSLQLSCVALISATAWSCA